MANTFGGIRDRSFGLNYNRGFNSGKSLFGQVADPEQGRIAGSAYQQRLGNAQQDRLAAARQQRQFDQERGNLNLQLGQAERENQRAFELGRGQMQNAADLGRLNAEVSLFPERQRMERFNQVFPFLRNALGDGSFDSGYQGGGQIGNQPVIDADNVYSDQQIQQQVNAQRASNDAATQGAQRRLNQQMSARGYGTQSPLAMELGMGLQNQNLATNTANERDLRYQAAEGNARQKITAQTAREQQFAARQQEDIERGRVQTGRYNALLGALAGLV